MEKIIYVQNLRKTYKKPHGHGLETAVDNLCFGLTPGSIMGLLGTNGAGKTTTLKMITNLCSKDKGKIIIDNVSLDSNPRLALARAMLGQPKLIILDEPANGLDPQGQINLYHLISDMAKEKNTTFIVSSHQLHDMEKFCTDILILDKGKSILQGKTEEILSETTNMVDCIPEEAKTFENVISRWQGICLASKKGNQFTIKLEDICIDEFIKKLVENRLPKQTDRSKKCLQDY